MSYQNPPDGGLGDSQPKMGLLYAERIFMSDTIRSLIYVLNCCEQRIKWYNDSNDTRHLVDSKTYLEVANIYMRELFSKCHEEITV